MRGSLAARWSAIGLALVLMIGPVMGENAAHDIANRFAGSEQSVKGQDADQRKTYESEMLERARQEAADRSAEEQKTAADAEKRQRAMEVLREAEAKALAEKLRTAGEARKAKAADAVVERPFKPALTNTDKSVKSDTATASTPIVVTPPPAPQPAEVARDPVPVSPPIAEPVAPVAITPQAPPKDIASEPAKVLPPPMALGRPQPVLPVAAAPADPRVTILLVMEPGTKGIRRFNKTADPVICEGVQCFVSDGPGAPARVMPLRKVLGPGNTFGKRAGACRSTLACVFRSVTLAGTAPIIQPVDLKVLVHDRREPRAISGDASCRVLAGKLTCSRTVVARGYRAWIVPEAIAETAGAAALESAVLRGLTPSALREASVTR